MRHAPLERMDREARRAFCEELMRRLSELVEGEAPEDFCRRIDETLGDCQAFRVYRDTLARTIELSAECGASHPPSTLVDESLFLDCVEGVRARLRE